MPRGIMGVVDDIHALRLTAERQAERVERIEAEVSRLDSRLATVERLISGLARDVDGVTDRLPDRNKGPVGKARDALTGDA